MTQQFTNEAQAREFVSRRVTCERTDEGGHTSWHVVDRLAVPRLILPFDDGQVAIDARDKARLVRLQEAMVRP